MNDGSDFPVIETAEAARDFAIDWQHSTGEEPMSWGEVADWQGFFADLARRFDLTDEFRENGVI